MVLAAGRLPPGRIRFGMVDRYCLHDEPLRSALRA